MSDVTNFTIDGVNIHVKDSNAVSIVANQGLTEQQKSNARSNIGAGDSDFSGSYNDLTDKPTIPTVNNGTLTIQKNGTSVQTFTANQSGNTTANIIVPTKTSELTNDSGYITDAGVTGVKGDSERNYRTGNVNITKGNIGLGNVPNVSTNNQAPTFTQASIRANITSGETLTTILGKLMKWYADLKTVAFSGSYSDLSDKPTIPTVNNGRLIIQKNGTDIANFDANQSGNTTANLIIPTKVSQVTNDSGYISDIVTTRIATNNNKVKIFKSNTSLYFVDTDLPVITITAKYQIAIDKITNSSDYPQVNKYFTGTLFTSNGVSLIPCIVYFGSGGNIYLWQNQVSSGDYYLTVNGVTNFY